MRESRSGHAIELGDYSSQGSLGKDGWRIRFHHHKISLDAIPSFLIQVTLRQGLGKEEQEKSILASGPQMKEGGETRRMNGRGNRTLRSSCGLFFFFFLPPYCYVTPDLRSKWVGVCAPFGNNEGRSDSLSVCVCVCLSVCLSAAQGNMLPTGQAASNSGGGRGEKGGGAGEGGGGATPQEINQRKGEGV